jgi:hypothetical protein
LALIIINNSDWVTKEYGLGYGDTIYVDNGFGAGDDNEYSCDCHGNGRGDGIGFGEGNGNGAIGFDENEAGDFDE